MITKHYMQDVRDGDTYAVKLDGERAVALLGPIEEIEEITAENLEASDAGFLETDAIADAQWYNQQPADFRLLEPPYPGDLGDPWDT